MTQQDAIDLLKLGGNTFLTGAAGSGKTHLLNKYIAHLRKHGVNVAITASTGIAATHIGGQTIHSWSGIGIADSLTDTDIDKLRDKKHLKNNYKKTKVLVIDEISMLHARQLDMVDQIARAMLDESKPFGGLQVILSGDFFQLPPVTKSNIGLGGSEDYENKFAYQCQAWENGNFNVCYLHEQFRQAGPGDKPDPLLTILNDIRSGNAGEHTRVPLRTRYKKDPVGSFNVSPTKLFAKNINVDSINKRELEKLPAQTKTFTMDTHGFAKLTDSLKRNCLAPEELHLKKGAEVMFVKNDQEGRYVNGTRGVVDAFDVKDGHPIVRTFEGLTIKAEPIEWHLEEDGAVRATIKQIPLRLAWAITIHKSQGMTLDTAEIDLSDTFEPGMGYVALSRVRTLDGLKLLGLNDTALSVHPQILQDDRQFQNWSEQTTEVLKNFSPEDKKRQQEEVLFDRFSGSRDIKKVAKKKKEKVRRTKTPTHLITKEFLSKELTPEEVAEERGLTVGTIISHMEKLAGSRELPNVSYIKKDIPEFDKILAEFKKSEDGKLSPIFKKFKEKYSFETLRLVRLFAFE